MEYSILCYDLLLVMSVSYQILWTNIINEKMISGKINDFIIMKIMVKKFEYGNQ